MFVAVLCVLGALVAGSQGQIMRRGRCPTVNNPDPAINVAQLRTSNNSPWTENRRYYSMFENGASCVRWQFTVPTTGTNPSPITATTTMTGGPGWGRSMVSRLTNTGGNTIGIYNYEMTQNPITGGRLTGIYNWRIVAAKLDGTDNEQYMLAYSCRDFYSWWKGNTHQEMMWILTKQNTLPDTMFTTIRTAAATANVFINTGDLQTTPGC